MNIETKMPGIGTDIFTTMSRLSIASGAINLAQGFPDFPVDPDLIERTSFYMREGKNQYAPMAGVPVLREQIALKINKMHGFLPDSETEITVTAGATEALNCVITALIRPGDEVIIFEPAYDSYAPVVRLNGGVLRPIKLTFPDYRIPWEEVRETVNNRTKLILINAPHNPTGTVPEPEDWAELRKITAGTNIFILADEVYEHLVFDDRRPHSVLCDPELRNRSFAVFSFGKTFHVTGWKTGYCVAPPALTAEMRKVHQYMTYSGFGPAQYALADYLKTPENYLNLPAFYQEKRDLFLRLTAGSAFRFLPSDGTYFILADYSNISDEPDTDFANRMTTDFGVAVIPISVFYEDKTDRKMVRFCYAKKAETLEIAAEKMVGILKG